MSTVLTVDFAAPVLVRPMGAVEGAWGRMVVVAEEAAEVIEWPVMAVARATVMAVARTRAQCARGHFNSNFSLGDLFGTHDGSISF